MKKKTFRMKCITYIMKHNYRDDSDLHYDSNIKYLQSLSDDELDKMTLYKFDDDEK